MNFGKYQIAAATVSLNTKIGTSNLAYPVLGLANEAGEVCGKVKKLFRDRNGIPDDEFNKMLISELGDVLWYLSETCTQFNISLDDVANYNIKKLFDRKDRGVIKGDGDNR